MKRIPLVKYNKDIEKIARKIIKKRYVKTQGTVNKNGK